MGPIAQLFALLQQAQQEREAPPHMGLLQEDSLWNPRKGIGPRPFRDPMQGGPEPPTSGPIASLYRNR